jgi:hypothetical protein
MIDLFDASGPERAPIVSSFPSQDELARISEDSQGSQDRYPSALNLSPVRSQAVFHYPVSDARSGATSPHTMRQSSQQLVQENTNLKSELASMKERLRNLEERNRGLLEEVDQVGCVGVWVCGCVVVWVCGCVGVWLCGCVAVWVCSCLAVWLFGCVGV